MARGKQQIQFAGAGEKRAGQSHTQAMARGKQQIQFAGAGEKRAGQSHTQNLKKGKQDLQRGAQQMKITAAAEQRTKQEARKSSKGTSERSEGQQKLEQAKLEQIKAATKLIKGKIKALNKQLGTSGSSKQTKELKDAITKLKDQTKTMSLTSAKKILAAQNRKNKRKPLNSSVEYYGNMILEKIFNKE
jgi:hypothetical protein